MTKKVGDSVPEENAVVQDVDFAINRPGPPTASTNDIVADVIPVDAGDSNIIPVSPTKNSKFRKSRQLVNKSKQKLMHGSLADEKQFKTKTRLQRQKLYFTKRGVSRAVDYKLIDINVLHQIMKKSCICKRCKTTKGEIVIEGDINARKGLAQSLIFKCKNCSTQTTTYTSTTVDSGISAFDVNVRSTYGSLQFGREGLAKFCGTLDLPPPANQHSYNRISNKLSETSCKIAETSMKEAAERLIAFTMEHDPGNVELQDDGSIIANVTVNIDGTWQKRGHASKHGVVFVVSVATGEVLDHSVKSLFCHQCTLRQNDNKNLDKFKRLYEEHSPNCSINLGGSSGAMECDAAVEIWLRSIETRSLRYTTFVGDGDSSCFGKVREASTNKYGNSYRVEKEEYVGHIRKRMGTGLREFKRKRSGQKLADGKGVGGMGRLTLAAMDRMQNNYGGN